MAQRIKGQEVSLSFVGPSGSEDGLADVLNFEAELQMEILREGYLGETVDRRDDIYRGVSGRCELHLESGAYFRFTQRVQDRAERRTPADGQFLAMASFQFPNGERVRLSFENIFFDALPIRAPERAGYVTVTVAWECERMRRIL
jgi:hypothetical protein